MKKLTFATASTLICVACVMAQNSAASNPLPSLAVTNDINGAKNENGIPLPAAPHPTAVPDTPADICISREAVDWTNAAVQNLSILPQENRIPVYYAVTVFYKRLNGWYRFKPVCEQSSIAGIDNSPCSIGQDHGLFIAVLPKSQKLTQLEPLRDLAGKTLAETGGYTEKRLWDDVRGISRYRLLVVAQEGFISKPKGAWNTFYHEFGHFVQQSLLYPHELAKLNQLYSTAKDKNLYLDDYAAQNKAEYFAQGVEAYLSESKGADTWKYSRHTKEELETKDPDLAAFIKSLMQ
jgi:hypothetical protein